MNLIRRLDILEDVLPKINDRLREYYVPKALKNGKKTPMTRRSSMPSIYKNF